MDIADLYGLPLERFVADRNALARELRAGGRRDEAKTVAALRKPSVAARAVNQLAREHPRQLRELFTAGDALSQAQSGVLAGRASGRDLSEAAERERAAVSSLVDAARSVLTAEGLTASASVLERVSETLHAAALDADAREPVDEGRLERELRHVGLGLGAGGTAPVPVRRKRGGAEQRAQDGGRTAAGGRAEAAAPADAQERAEARERAEAEERVKARKQAKAAEAEARRVAARTVKALDAAELKRSRADEALKRAEEALTKARAASEAAEKAHDAAVRHVHELA